MKIERKINVSYCLPALQSCDRDKEFEKESSFFNGNGQPCDTKVEPIEECIKFIAEHG